MPGVDPKTYDNLVSRWTPHEGAFEDTGSSDPAEDGDVVLRLPDQVGSNTLVGAGFTLQTDANGWKVLRGTGGSMSLSLTGFTPGGTA